VVGQLEDDLGAATAVLHLQLPSQAEVERSPPGRLEVAVDVCAHPVVAQLVPQPVVRAARAVARHMASHERRQRRIEGLTLQARDGAKEPDGGRLAVHRQELEQSPGLGVERGDAAAEDIGHAVGDAQLSYLPGGGPDTGRQVDGAVLDELAHHLLDEEGHAGGLLEDASHERLWQNLDAEHRREDLLHLRCAQRGKSQVIPSLPARPLLDDGSKRCPRHLVFAIGAHGGQLDGAAGGLGQLDAPRKVHEHIEGRLRGPLEVVDDQEARRAVGHVDEEGGECLEQAQALSLSVVQVRRRGRFAAWARRRVEVDELWAVAHDQLGLPAPLGDGHREARELRERTKGRGARLVTAPVQHGHAGELGMLPNLADEARLANPARTGHQQQRRRELVGAHRATPKRPSLVEGHDSSKLRVTTDEAAREDVALTSLLRLELVALGAPLTDRLDHRIGGAIAVGGHFGAQPLERLAEPGRHEPPVLGGERQRVERMPVEQLPRARGREGQTASDQLIQEDPEAIQVEPMVQLEHSHELGSHVVRSTAQLAGTPCHARQPEVDHLHLAPVGDQHVAGLEVVVDDAATVEVGEGAAERHDQLEHLLEAGALGGLEEVPAKYQLHREERGLGRVGSLTGLEVVDAADVGMAQAAHRPELGLQQAEHLAPERRGGQRLECERAAVAGFVGDPVHDPHAAATQLPLDPIAPAHQGVDRERARSPRRASGVLDPERRGARRHPQRPLQHPIQCGAPRRSVLLPRPSVDDGAFEGDPEPLVMGNCHGAPV
jgi:hypothetical protein